MIARTLLLVVTVALSPIAARAGSPPPEPPGYRLDQYNAPTPLTVAGRNAIDTAEAQRLWTAHAANFIDVIAAPRRPDSLPAGSLWLPTPHLDIPGSLWLPDSGRGALSPELERWFRTSLAQITAARDDTPLVFYCRTDCWLSWNATKRAIEWGYSGARWYRDGSDGWRAAGLPLAETQPPNDAPH
jgi:PQQ-dependent catabolism-associated CXXCW motif protein